MEEGEGMVEPIQQNWMDIDRDSSKGHLLTEKSPGRMRDDERILVEC